MGDKCVIHTSMADGESHNTGVDISYISMSVDGIYSHIAIGMNVVGTSMSEKGTPLRDVIVFESKLIIFGVSWSGTSSRAGEVGVCHAAMADGSYAHLGMEM